MTPNWAPLDQELTRWQELGLTLPLWWRDDDAIAPSPQLDQLTRLSAQLGLPVHLAVIPRDATDALADFLQNHPNLVPVVHGWAHKNHAPPDQKKAEFGPHRPLSELKTDAKAALDHLHRLIGTDLRPMFVPPWNRITPDLLGDLPALGYRAVSTFTPRKTPEAAPGLAQINTHLDPIDWKGSRSLADPDALIAQVVRQMQDRRESRADTSEPYGILTHHLVHDDAIWQFTQQLIARLMTLCATGWAYDERISQ